MATSVLHALSLMCVFRRCANEYSACVCSIDDCSSFLHLLTRRKQFSLLVYNCTAVFWISPES